MISVERHWTCAPVVRGWIVIVCMNASFVCLFKSEIERDLYLWTDEVVTASVNVINGKTDREQQVFLLFCENLHSFHTFLTQHLYNYVSTHSS